MRIKQSWVHIENVYLPSHAQKIRQVMDIFTNERVIEINLSSEYFVGLKVIGRNPYTTYERELAFIDKSDNENSCILVNLDPLSSFPRTDERLCNKEDFEDDNTEPEKEKEPISRHIKMEIEYIITRPNIKDDHWFRNFFYPQKIIVNEIYGFIQPEFYIAIPPGWRMSGGQLINKITKFCNYFRSSENKKVVINEGEGVVIRSCIEKDNGEGLGVDKKRGGNAIILKAKEPKLLINKLILDSPFISAQKGKLIYNYLINPKCYNTLMNFYTKKYLNKPISFRIIFVTRHSLKITAISWMPLIFLFFSACILRSIILMMMGVSTPFCFNLQFSMAYLIALLSFSYFYITYIKEGYQIPRPRLNYLIGIISYITIILVVYINIWIIPCCATCAN